MTLAFAEENNHMIDNIRQMGRLWLLNQLNKLFHFMPEDLVTEMS